MSGSDPKTSNGPDPSGKNPENGGGGGRPPNVLFGGIIGYTSGFLIAAAVVVLIRMMDSESDGMRAIFHSLAILGPALILVVLMWVMHKRSKGGGGISKGAMKVCAVVGLASGAAIWVTAPTNDGMAAELMDENRDLIEGRAEQLAACRAQIDDYPKGSLGERVTDEQLAELKTVAMNFEHSEYNLPGEWNALLTTDTDYARLKVGTDPDSIMDRWGRPDAGFFRPSDSRYSYGMKDKVDDIAQTAYGESYLWLDKLERLVKELEQMKYVVIVRMDEFNPPLLTGDNFQWGYLDGEAFCFDLPEKRLIAAFKFAATNSEKVSYNYAKNSNVTAKADSAGQALKDDLVKNGWTAFWKRFHELAEAAKSPWGNDELPYKPIILAEAMLVLRNKRAEEAEREKAVLAELEGGEGKKPDEAGSAEATTIELSDEQEAEVRKLLAEEGKIGAIRRVREITGKGLRECKDYVDALEESEAE